MLRVNGKALRAGAPLVTLEPCPPSWEVGGISPSPPMSSMWEQRKLRLRETGIFPKSQSKVGMEPGFKSRPGRPELGVLTQSPPHSARAGWPVCPSLRAPAQVVPGHETHPEGKEKWCGPDPSLPTQTKPRVSLLSGDFPKVPGPLPGGGTGDKQTRDPETETERTGRQIEKES